MAGDSHTYRQATLVPPHIIIIPTVYYSIALANGPVINQL